MKKLFTLALCAFALLSTPALAQLPPIVRSLQPYVALPGSATALTGIAGDDLGTLVPLGFTFPYLGANYTHVMINSNGVLVPSIAGGTTCASGCYSNAGFPATGTPNPAIAAFWDDLTMSSSGSVRYVSGPGEFTVEYIAVPRLSYTANTVTFQIKLSASGSITFWYGTITGTAANWNFSAGFEDAAGTTGANLLTCTSQTTCVGTDFPPSGTMFTVGEPNAPDLAVSTVTIANFTTATDGNVSFTVNSTLRNFGRTQADNFMWRAFLSRDQFLDTTATDGGADVQVAEGGPESLPGVDGGVTLDGGFAIVAVTGTGTTTTPPATGEYFVLVQVDPTNVVTEASENNNVGSTITAFVQGTDLLATSISGPASTGGGNPENFPISFTNRGTTPAGNVDFRIYLSLDQTLDVNSDFPVFTGTRAVSGGQTISETVPVTIPTNAPNGDFYWILKVDSADAVTEANEANNVVASAAKVTILRADLIAEAASFLDPVTNLPTTTARFGDTIQFKVRYRNSGGANGNNFKIALALSSDSSLSLLSDTYVCDQTVTLLAPSTTSSETTLNCTLPLRNAAMRPFTTGLYYLFGVVDATGAVFESNKTNNNQMIGPVRLTAPGPDLAVTSITAPASAGVGEVIPLVRTIRNLGNLDAPQATYRFYASANDIITPDDVLLRIVDNATERDEGTVTLTRGTGTTATELVRLPGTMPAGTYYLGCIVDPPNAVMGDLDLSNNALASRTMVIAPSSLRIVNTVLPDAVVGRAYSYRLSAAGEQGASTWRIDPLLGAAPAWLTIGAADGLLSGTPPGTDGDSVVGVTVVLENSGRQTATRLALRVLPTTSPLAVTTTSLPAVVNSSTSQYQFQLGAAGGLRPYSWRVATGTLPTGMALGADGTLFGSPRNATNGTSTLTFEVRDAAGGVALEQLALKLIAPGALTFRTISAADAIVGLDYLQDIAVMMEDGSMLAKPLTWRVTGNVPGGLVSTPRAEIISIGGRPTQAGTFSFTIGVEDANGRTDSLEFTMTVHAPRYRVTANVPEVVRPDEVVNITLSVTPSGAVTYRLVGGVLPPGLSLDAGGAITGTVASDGAEGLWAFVVEAEDANGMSGLNPLSIRVERAARVVGCSVTSGGSPAALGLVFAMLALLRRRRRA